MDTARRLFAAEGYYAVSMRRIAEAIEYSPTAIYVHFKDKESLIRELCTEDFGKLGAEFMRLATVKDPVDRIRQAGQLYIRFAVEHPNHYKLMFMTEMSSETLEKLKPNEMPQHGNPEEDAYAFLEHSVREAMQTGRFRPELTDVPLVTQTFWAIVHGVASLHVAKGNDPWVAWASLEDRAECAINAALSGLVADKQNWFSCPIPKLFKRKRAGK
jgi:AcrR family transcriptional regulator